MTDKSEAKKRTRIEDVKFDRWIADLEAGRNVPSAEGASNLSAPRHLSMAEWTDYVREYVAEEDALSKARSRKPPPDLEDRLSNGEVEAEAWYWKTALRDPENIDGAIAIHAALTKVSKRAGTETAFPVPSELYDLVGRGLQEIARRQEARFKDGFSQTFYDPEFQPPPPGTKPKAGGMSFRLRWSRPTGQIGGHRKLGPVVRHAASLMSPASSWTSTGVRPPCVE